LVSGRLVTQAIQAALRTRFAGAEWACFFEVPSGTGAAAGRSADAVAMNMFPSRGLRVHGIEVKASRSDWLRELRDPAKAEAIQRYCDHWWIAAASDVVRPDELPPTWGLLELYGKTLRQRVAAPLLQSEPMSRAFIAALLRCAAGRASKELYDQVRLATETAREAVEERVREEVAREVARKTREHGSLAKTVEEFEAASGIRLTDGFGWAGGTAIGKAAKLVHDLGLVSSYGTIRRLAQQARAFADQTEAALSDCNGDGDDEEEA
jgi:hypothetical protein